MASVKVSIIIPVYNGSNYLANAIDCALNQTYKNIEVIVVNDGSSDNGATEKIALEYGDKIKYIYKDNGGVSSALNMGISAMSGEYFSWLSHDDLYSQDKVECALNLLKKNNAIGKKVVAFTSGYFIDSTGTKLKNFPTYFNENKLYSGVEVVNAMTKKGTLNGCCMLIPNNAFIEVGGFDESLRYSQDALMWYKIFLSGYSLISDNFQNVMYRLHRKQTSQLRRDLFEHDSLIIAKLLLEPLAVNSQDSDLLFNYIKRLSKYNCKQAINYMCQLSRQNGYLSKTDLLKLDVHKAIGYIRYKIVSNGKKLLILLNS